MERILKNWWMILIKGIILIILSFVVFQYPVGASVGFSVYLGIALLLAGAFLIVGSLSMRETLDNWGWRLAEGIIDVLLAFFIFTHAGLTAETLPLILGFWIMFYGVLMTIDAIGASKDAGSNRWANIALGIMITLLGYFISSNLLAGAISISLFMGLAFLLLGIVYVLLSLKIRKMGQEIIS